MINKIEISEDNFMYIEGDTHFINIDLIDGYIEYVPLCRKVKR